MQFRLADLRVMLMGIVLSVLALCGCASDPLVRIAERSALTDETVSGSPFLHRVLSGEGDKRGSNLHVYLAGDGVPWRSGHRVSVDPSPRNPIMLKMMALDEKSRVYVGRPCYHQVKDPRCVPALWTDSRYSEEVVASMDAVISRYADSFQGIVLFGHSGGATLAMLLASKRDDVVAVVTIAGNLDIEGWTKFHQFDRLNNSLNPVLQKPLSVSVVQHHYIGSEDSVIPRSVHREAVEYQYQISPILVPGYDHNCCWEDRWPQILRELDESLKSPSDNRQ